MEMLDIVNEQGEPVGTTIERASAHQTGARHRSTSVWLFRVTANGLEVLLQKRSAAKDSHPGEYDISSAGHVPAGSDYLESALRELGEELGLIVPAESLIDCGMAGHSFSGMFYGNPFNDNEVSRIYALDRTGRDGGIAPDSDEVESVRWFHYRTLCRALREHRFENCVRLPELQQACEGYIRAMNAGRRAE